MYCKFCGKEMEDGKSYCFNCDKFQDMDYTMPKSTNTNNSIPKRRWFWIIVAVLVFAAVSGKIASQFKPSSISPDFPDSVSQDIAVTIPTKVEVIAVTEALKEEDHASFGEKNALRSARSYLSFSAFSYNGLIEQLEFEGYSTSEATYAAKNCGADWNEQALKSAKSYLSFSAFSYSGLIAQLEFEGFTTTQATYGADNCQADWNEQAAKSAKSYLQFTSFSRQGLIDQLLFEGFTQSQAEYGARAVGY